MDPNHPPRPEPGQNKPSRAEAEERNRRFWIGIGNFIDQIHPWLNEAGIIIFSSLIALNLVVLASLFTIGPVDLEVKIATAALAFALPLKVTGLLLLRVVRESRNYGLEDRLAQSFRESGFIQGQAAEEASSEEKRKRRTRNALRMSLFILVLSILLLLVALTAIFWHMAWWIAVGFCLIVLICLIILL